MSMWSSRYGRREQCHRYLDAERFQERRELSVELDPDCRDGKDSEAAELRARLLDREPGVFVGVFPDDCPQWRVEHGAGIVPEHLLGDGDVAHQIGDAVVVVVGELHHAVDVVAPVDEESVGGELGVGFYDLGPARSTLDERVDLLDRIRRDRLLVAVLELADARNLDG